MTKYLFFLLFTFNARCQDTLDLSSCKLRWNIHSCSLDSNSTQILLSYLDTLTISSHNKISIYFEEAYTNEAEQNFTKCRGESLKSFIENNFSFNGIELKTKAEFVILETMRNMIYSGTRRKIYLFIE